MYILECNEMIQLSKHIFIETVSYEQQAFVFVLYLFQKPLANFFTMQGIRDAMFQTALK